MPPTPTKKPAAVPKVEPHAPVKPPVAEPDRAAAIADLETRLARNELALTIAEGRKPSVWSFPAVKREQARLEKLVADRKANAAALVKAEQALAERQYVPVVRADAEKLLAGWQPAAEPKDPERVEVERLRNLDRVMAEALDLQKERVKRAQAAAAGEIARAYDGAYLRALRDVGRHLGAAVMAQARLEQICDTVRDAAPDGTDGRALCARGPGTPINDVGLLSDSASIIVGWLVELALDPGILPAELGITLSPRVQESFDARLKGHRRGPSIPQPTIAAAPAPEKSVWGWLIGSK